MLLVTIRDTESQHSLFSGRWMQVTKLQSQRKSLSTPEEPYALDILIITMQVRKMSSDSRAEVDLTFCFFSLKPQKRDTEHFISSLSY